MTAVEQSQSGPVNTVSEYGLDSGRHVSHWVGQVVAVSVVLILIGIFAFAAVLLREP